MESGRPGGARGARAESDLLMIDDGDDDDDDDDGDDGPGRDGDDVDDDDEC